MNDVISSVVDSLDGRDPDIYPFLSYILQDIRELGADPETIIRLMALHLPNQPLHILDLGCGKGAVSVPVASRFDCRITGIDAMPDFIEEARRYAAEKNVSDRCSFSVGDIRTEFSRFRDYDIAILGSIGNVFGELKETLLAMKSVIKPVGYVILDDGWVSDQHRHIYPRCQPESEYYAQISETGFVVVDEVRHDPVGYTDSENHMMQSMRKRCDELIIHDPRNSRLLQNYIRNQEREFRFLQEIITCVTLLLKNMA